ncbi:putative serine carboxypeptidase CPVL isoform X2 [Ictidomys tridecemlineatus]
MGCFAPCTNVPRFSSLLGEIQDSHYFLPLILNLERSRKVQPETAPVVLWLQGGPGGSSMFGLFVEHGPYVITSNMTVLPRNFPWTTTLSMLYMDNPVGTGFSFTNNSQGYAVNEDDVAHNLHSALVQFFQLFPEYETNDFYATGEEPGDQTYYGKFLSLSEVRRAIHVGNQTFSDGADVEKYLRQDTMKSVKTWLTEIMNNDYKVLLYNGQLDIIVAASLTERSLMTMNWKGSRKYKKSRRVVWKIFKSDNEVAGYVRQVENFHQVIVRGGGHILPLDQPLRSFDMINRFIFGKGWNPYD